MNYRGYVNSKANDYKQYLLEELKTNTELTRVVNSVFFPGNLNIQQWVEETEIESFREYTFKGDLFVNKICTLDEINNILFLSKSSNDFSRYAIFSYVKCNSYEKAIEKAHTFYHFVKKDFYKIIDKVIFDRLKEYKRENGNSHFYTKRISNHISLTLCTEREYMEQTGIIGYNLPSLSIKIGDEGIFDFGTIDVRSLLFLPEKSFLFFYTDSHNYTVDMGLRIIRDVTRKNDEPVIYYLEEEQKYLVTNSRENIDRYNKYIQIILELSFHYYSVFEKWLTQLLVTKNI